MSWLHNSGGGHRPNIVQMPHRPVSAARVRWSLKDALGEAARRIPSKPTIRVESLLKPCQVVALLAACETHGAKPPEEAVSAALWFRAQPDDSEEAIAALEDAGKRRGLTGALIAQEISGDSASQNVEFSPKGVSLDLEMTLLVLSKSAQRIFLATKQPVLERLRFDLTIETYSVDIFQKVNP